MDDETLRATLAAIELRQERRHKAALIAFGWGAAFTVAAFFVLAPYIDTATAASWSAW